MTQTFDAMRTAGHGHTRSVVRFRCDEFARVEASLTEEDGPIDLRSAHDGSRGGFERNAGESDESSDRVECHRGHARKVGRGVGVGDEAKEILRDEVSRAWR